MRRAFYLALTSSVVLAGVVAACKSSDEAPPAELYDDAGTVIPPGPPGGDDDDAGGEVKPAAPETTGLPCEVQGLLENRCAVCHTKESPKGPLLVTYEDLKAPSTRDATKSRAQLAVELMKAKEMPKPPALPAYDDEIAEMEAWVKAGLPKNKESCTPIDLEFDGGAGAMGDGGTAGDGGCTSGKTWKGGNGPDMRPGEACIACHSVVGGPAFRFAGTVYPSLHEPNGCNGSTPPITVTVTGSNGQTETLQVNGAGNFSSEGGKKVKPPYTVKVTSAKGTRAMQRKVSGGDCNTCHSQAGAQGAPGRILAP